MVDLNADSKSDTIISENTIEQTFQMMRIRTSFSLMFAIIVAVFPTLPGYAENGPHSKPARRVILSASELDYPPFSVIRDDGSADGFSVELLNAVAEAAGFDVKYKVGPWSEIKQELIEGRLDALPLVSYSKVRDKVLDFTAPYLRMHGTIFVRKGEKSIKSEVDLKNREVLVMRGDTAHEYAVRKQLSDKLILTDSFEDALKKLSAGKHDAVIIQHLVGLQLLKKLDISNLVSVRSLQESSLKPVAEQLSGFEQKFCIAVKEGDKELLARLNEGLSIAIASGVYDSLYDKWFGPILPQPSVSLVRLGKYLLFILLPVIAIFGIVGVWFLKREVARKTITIKENEEKFSVVFNKSPFPVSLSRLGDGTLVDVNESWVETFGFGRSEAIGHTPAELGISTNPEEQAHLNAAVLEKGTVKNLELHGYRTRSNSSPVILANIEVIEFGGEKFIFMSEQDVTDRKRAEEALAASEKKYRELLETANSIIIRLNNQGDIIFINEYGLRFFGYSAAELIGQDVMTIVPKVEKTTGKNLDALVMDIVINPESYTQVPNENVRKDGQIVWVTWTNKAILDEQGNVQEILTIGNDITAMKMTEQALRKSERRLSLAVSATADAIWEWNLVTQKTYYSPRWCEMLGYKEQEISMNADGWKRLCHPEDLQPTLNLIWDRVDSADDTGYTAEFRMRKKDGSWIWVLSRGRVVERDKSGKPVLLSGTNTDITERKKAEVALRRLAQFPEENPNPVLRISADGTLLYENAAARSRLSVLNLKNGKSLPDPLAVAVEKARGQDDTIECEFTFPDGRTFGFFAIKPSGEDYINIYGMDLTERKKVENALRKSEERIRASLVEKEVLLKEIHHRVKNNMQVISSLVDLQAHEVKDAAMQDIFRDVVYRVRTMAMVHEKLYQSSDLARVDFADYAQSLLSYLWRVQVAATSGINLDLDLEPIFLPVSVAVPCGLILNELFSNALKHAFVGSNTGKVIVSLRGDPQGKVHLGVRDNGIGLPKEIDWRQAKTLGLRLVQMLARQLHADVMVTGDRGSEFAITFERSGT